MESFHPIGMPETRKDFFPAKRNREYEERIISLSAALDEEGRSYEGQRIIAHLKEYNPEIPQFTLALRFATKSLEWLQRLGKTLHEKQGERDYIHVANVPHGYDMYMNMHDGILYVRDLENDLRITPLRSFTDVEAVFELQQN